MKLQESGNLVKNGKFNKLKYLQTQIEQSLENWKVFDNTSSRIELFNVFNKLVVESMQSDYGITGEKCYNYAFHYSLDLLDRFLVGHEFQKGLSGKEIYEYIKFSIEQYLAEDNHKIEAEFFEDFEAFTKETPDDEMLNYEIFTEMQEVLHLFFPEHEVKRYLPLALNIISSGYHSKIVSLKDEQFKYFCMLLISLGKKLGKYYTENVNTCNYSVNEITILLAGINFHKIPRELVFALDLSSLDRLVEFAGGSTIVVPTREELSDAYNEIKNSVRYPSLHKRSAPLESNFGSDDTVTTVDSTYQLFCGWLEENKKGLSQDKLDKILKILSE